MTGHVDRNMLRTYVMLLTAGINASAVIDITVIARIAFMNIPRIHTIHSRPTASSTPYTILCLRLSHSPGIDSD